MPATSVNLMRRGRATVTRIDLDGFEAARLKAMGLYEGQTIELSRVGNPCIVRAAGSKMALANEIASHIMVVCDEA